jgi:heptosyltransferase-2
MIVGIFHTAFLGDLALTSLLIEALHRSKHEIHLFTNAAGADLYRSDPRITKITLIEKGRTFQKVTNLVKNAKVISSTPLDYLICPHKSATTAITAKLSNAKQIVGFKHASLSFLYDEQVSVDRSLHEVIRVLSLAPKDLVTPDLLADLDSIARPILRISHSSGSSPSEITAKIGNPFAWDKPYIIIAPGSVWATKMYPPELYADAISQVLLHPKHTNLLCVVTGSRGDAEAIERFMIASQQNARSVTRIVNAQQKLTLSELSDLIANARVVIANDSAPVHIASGHNRPVIALFGPTVPEFGFAPTSSWSRVIDYEMAHKKRLSCQPCSIHGQKKCPLTHHNCMTQLPPKIVVDFILEALDL